MVTWTCPTAVRHALAVVVLVSVGGCTTSSGEPFTPPSLTFADGVRSLDEVGCEGLVSEVEMRQIVSEDLVAAGGHASSCYWTSGDQLVQLVVQTGDVVDTWRTELRASFTEPIDALGFEIWKEDGSTSVAGFGPRRGVIVHGVRNEASAVRLLELVLSRL